MADNMKDSIVFVTSRIPFPAISGRKTSLYHYCRILKEIGYKVIVVSFDDGTDLQLKPQFIDNIIILPSIKKLTKLGNIIKYSFIKKMYPLQVSLYYDEQIKLKIQEIVKNYHAKIVIADMARTTEYLKPLENVQKIADLDDLISIRYKRQLETDIESVNPYGTFLYSLPKFIQKLMMLNFLKKRIMKLEIKLLQKYEDSVHNFADNIVLVAENECQILNSRTQTKKAVAVPIGVDTDYFANKYDSNIKDNYLCFLGNLSVSHNECAVKNFVNYVMPLLLKVNQTIKFLVIGDVNNNLSELANDNIIFTGKVDDIRDYILQCKLFVCPLTFGSGIKTKNLEAMSLGIPVVTTSIGAENINAKNMHDWIVVDDWEEMSKNILDLLADNQKRSYIGKNGASFVRQNFTWDIAKEHMREILEKK